MMDEDYQVHLANPSRVQQYSGLKHGDDEDDGVTKRDGAGQGTGKNTDAGFVSDRSLLLR
jgi:hypothetical protein